jgi:L-asparaginase II
MARIVAAMGAHPDLVAGEGRACTELMRAMDGTVLKTGAEGVFVAILPDRRLGIALKIVDGATRASEAAIAAILVLTGALDPDHPTARRRLSAPILTRRGAPAAEVRPALGD